MIHRRGVIDEDRRIGVAKVPTTSHAFTGGVIEELPRLAAWGDPAKRCAAVACDDARHKRSIEKKAKAGSSRRAASATVELRRSSRKPH